MGSIPRWSYARKFNFALESRCPSLPTKLQNKILISYISPLSVKFYIVLPHCPETTGEVSSYKDL